MGHIGNIIELVTSSASRDHDAQRKKLKTRRTRGSAMSPLMGYFSRFARDYKAISVKTDARTIYILKLNTQSLRHLIALIGEVSRQ